jgi:hypothetical protein
MDGPVKPPFPAGDRAAVVLTNLLIPGMLLLLLVIAGCTGPTPALPASSTMPAPVLRNQTGLELVFFHPVPGCDSCNRVGLLANETASLYFASELASGKLTFRDVNLNLPENRLFASRYGAYTESLWLGRYNETGFHATEITDIWYYANNRDQYLQYLRGVLERELAGTG